MSMKNLPWFRVYGEMVDDEKLRLLAFEDRWHFVAILCCKSRGILDDADLLLKRKLAVKLGVQVDALDEIARRLAEVGLIERETFQPIAWDKRQFRSDTDPTAAERQRRRRELKGADQRASIVGHAHVTRDSRVKGQPCHGPVTALDSDTESDRRKTPSSPAAPAKITADEGEKTWKTYPTEFLEFWVAYPRKQGKLAALRRWEQAIRVIGGERAHAIATLLAGAQRYAKAAAGIDADKVKMAEGWLNAGRWEDEDVAEAANVPLDWWKAAPGYEAKARALSLAPRASDESMQDFRVRVLVAAGPGEWQDDEVARAERDNAIAYVTHLRKLFGLAPELLLAAVAAPVPAPVPAAPEVKSAPTAGFKQALAGLKAANAG